MNSTTNDATLRAEEPTETSRICYLEAKLHEASDTIHELRHTIIALDQLRFEAEEHISSVLQLWKYEVESLRKSCSISK